MTFQGPPKTDQGSPHDRVTGRRVAAFVQALCLSLPRVSPLCAVLGASDDSSKTDKVQRLVPHVPHAFRFQCREQAGGAGLVVAAKPCFFIRAAGELKMYLSAELQEGAGVRCTGFGRALTVARSLTPSLMSLCTAPLSRRSCGAREQELKQPTTHCDNPTMCGRRGRRQGLRWLWMCPSGCIDMSL